MQKSAGKKKNQSNREGSAFTYRCTKCGQAYNRDEIRYLCPVCAASFEPGQPLEGVLEAVFDYEDVAGKLDRIHPDWSLLCPVESRFHPPFQAGGTPLVQAHSLGNRFGCRNLLIKNDGLNPSGSLKDRASFLVAAEAERLGINRIIAASTGNAASSMAAICAASGKEAIIFAPQSAPRAKLAQILIHGATLILVKGTYDDAFRLSLEYSREEVGLNRNTAYHPLTIEGKKTVSFEIFEQCGNRVPDTIFVPVGDGVVISGVHKGFKDLLLAGLSDSLPRLICVQAERSDAIHHLITTGKYRNAQKPDTLADSISVSAPSNAWMAAQAVKESGGLSLTLTDREILEGQRLLAETTGIFAEPAAASVVAALGALEKSDFDRTGHTVLLITGHGLKDVDAVLQNINLPELVEPDLVAVKEKFGI